MNTLELYPEQEDTNTNKKNTVCSGPKAIFGWAKDLLWLMSCAFRWKNPTSWISRNTLTKLFSMQCHNHSLL